VSDSIDALRKKVREGLCPNWGAQPHGGCTYCAQNEDAINALTALAERAKKAERERDAYGETLSKVSAEHKKQLDRAEAAEAALKEAGRERDELRDKYETDTDESPAPPTWEMVDGANQRLVDLHAELERLCRVEEAAKETLPALQYAISQRHLAVAAELVRALLDALVAASPCEGEGE
jgi:hypothetical protein